MNNKDRVKDKILELLNERDEGKTICPSEVARELYPKNWREYMEEIREVAEDLRAKEIIEITQRGKIVHDEYKGPIRLRLTNRFIK